jgi:sugar phosphate isomerase/epimerase
LEQRGLALCDLVVIPTQDGAPLLINDPDDERRAHARRFVLDALEFAALLEAPGVTIQPGTDWSGVPHAESLERTQSELGWCASAARERGLRLSIEPHLGSVCERPDEVLAVCESAPGLELTLDHSHFVAQGLTEASCDALIPYARHVHMRGAARGRLQTPLASSTLDHAAIVASLRASGYSGFITVEYWVDPILGLDVLSETALMHARLRSLLAA